MEFLTLYFLLISAHLVFTLVHEKPVAAKVWSERCERNSIAMNDCNWCICDVKMQYKCNARACNEVDMFGHFNDAIKEMYIGIDGHGVWRSEATPCEPGVHYRKGALLCVCTDEGKWPNPVCRDVFQILHSVETTEYDRPDKNHTCSANKLYLYGCNVCFCPSSGNIDPNLCTKRNCFNENVVRSGTQEDQFDEIYASCNPALRYRLGCQTCTCLRNNRLLCDNCTVEDGKEQLRMLTSMCSGHDPGVIFQSDCNFCHCDKKETIFCTSKKCIPNNSSINLPNIIFEIEASAPDDFNCIPGTMYQKDCNICHCFMFNGVKYFGCTMNLCKRPDNGTFPLDCVENTAYQINCLICHCVKDNGVKREFCTVDETCNSENSNPVPLSSMHGYCEPMHFYQIDCNKCRCLADGHTVACTSRICSDTKMQRTTVTPTQRTITRQSSRPFSKSRLDQSQRPLEPLIMEFIPFIEKDNECPIGRSYKIDCNFCYCMKNGNAVCSTKQCI